MIALIAAPVWAQWGDAGEIAQTILDKKTIGTSTYGSTTETAYDPYGTARDVKFSRPTQVPIFVEISLHPLQGYTSAIGDAAKAAVVAYIEALLIGDDVILTRLYMPANLYGALDSTTYEITLIRIKKSGSFAAADIVIAFNEIATAIIANATLLIV